VTKAFGDYELDDDLGRVDFDTVHSWLTNTYWSPGISREKVVRAAQNTSLVVSAYHGDTQVAYMRLISDKTTFAWVSDVFVDVAHRGKGLATAMMQFALDHPDYQGLRRWVLATKDAHNVYSKVGFELIPNPERWMIKRNSNWRDG
jgi:GNAT superfamily N-acetyltransferase